MAFSDACELRFASGTFLDPGPVQVWVRLTVPVLDGEHPSGAQRIAAADFGNGVSGALPADRYLFINPDLTIHLLRPPVGEWIGMDSRSTTDRRAPDWRRARCTTSAVGSDAACRACSSTSAGAPLTLGAGWSDTDGQAPAPTSHRRAFSPRSATA